VNYSSVHVIEVCQVCDVPTQLMSHFSFHIFTHMHTPPLAHTYPPRSHAHTHIHVLIHMHTPHWLTQTCHMTCHMTWF